MNPEVFSPTFVPQVAVLGSGALAHDVTVQCVSCSEFDESTAEWSFATRNFAVVATFFFSG